MMEEMHFLMKDNVWVLIKKLQAARVMGNKWIFKHKEGIVRVEPARFEARVVAQGYLHR